MQRAMTKVMGEYPDTKPVTLSPSSGGLGSFLTGLMMPRGALAVTNPFTGNITYDPNMMSGQSPTEQEQTIAHELTHSRQAQTTPWWKTAMGMFQPDAKVPAGVPKNSPMNDPYYWRSSEMEAYQTERDRAQRTHIPYYVDPVTGSRDLWLPNQRRGIDTSPSPQVIQRAVSRPSLPDPLADALAKSKAGMKLSPIEQAALNKDLNEYHQSTYYKSLMKGK